MSTDDSDAELIAASVDENGDDVPQDHPIENPGENGEEGGDPIAEPHPDEPGSPDDADEEDTSKPADD